MPKDIKKLYIICLSVFAVLLAAVALENVGGYISSACLMIFLAVLTSLVLRKRVSCSTSRREVLLISTLIGIIFAVAIQSTGVYFSFYKNPYFVNLGLLLTRILPSAALIVAGEITRRVLLCQRKRFSNVTAYFVGFMSELLLFYKITQLTSVNRFMDLVGLTLFPAITSNIYYHYLSKRYGALPNIIFRSITTLYIYFIPTVTGMSDSLASCIKIIFPILMLALVSAMFEKKKKNAVKKGKRLGAIGTVLTSIVIVSVAMLISCQFRFGALVIATESMTGEINKGDMIIYEQYDNQFIKEGQVIVFTQNESKIVHRVVKIENIGGELRYYTKGDANDSLDTGYRTQADVVGLTDAKIAFVGYPTLWLREIIKK